MTQVLLQAHLRLSLPNCSLFNGAAVLVSTSDKPNFYSQFKLVATALVLLLQFGCAAYPKAPGAPVLFANPPTVGSWLTAQRELVACDTEAAARYMANFGFFHPQCTQLTNIGSREYQVQNRTKVQLSEGPMWLLRVQYEQSLLWVPIPWHDWL